MAYDSTTGKITAPYKDGKQYGVEIADLQRCFQVKLTKTVNGVQKKGYSCDLGAIIRLKVGDKIKGFDVISRQEINMWSKFKPVKSKPFPYNASRLNTFPFINTNTMKWKNDDFQWWRDTLGQNASDICVYGIVPIIHNDLDDILDAYLEGQQWGYCPPLGGLNDPYRINDFLEYNHKAPEPAGVNLPDSVLKYSGTWSLNVALVQSQDADGTEIESRDFITPADILNTVWPNGAHFGFALYKASNNSKIKAVIGNDMIGDQNSINESTEYYIVPFFANTNNINTASAFSTIPNSSLGKLQTSQNLVHAEARYILNATVSVTNRVAVKAVISLESVISGVTYDSKEFTNVTIFICKSDTPETNGNPSSGYVLSRYDFGNIYLVGGSRWEQTVDYRIVTSEGANEIKSVKCFLYADGVRKLTSYARRPQWAEPQLIIE